MSQQLQVPSFSIENVVLDPSGQVYVKYPIGNINYKNKADWKFTAHKDQLFSFLDSNLGHPLVLAFHSGKFGHPVIALAGDRLDQVYEKNAEFQKPYIIGVNDRVYREIDGSGFVYGRYEVTDPKAQAFYRDYFNSFKNGQLSNYNSIALVFDKDETNRNGIQKGKILHNALVSEPEWGVDSKIKGICIGEDKKCDSVLAYAGNIACVVCPEKQQQVFDFLSIMKSYLEGDIQPNRFNILFAGDKLDMSTEPPKEKPTEGADTKKDETKIDNSALQNLKTELKDDLKNQIDDALAGIKAKTETPADQKPKDDKPETTVPQSVFDAKIKEITDKYDNKINEVLATVKTQNETIQKFEKNENDTEIGKELLVYRDMFKNKEGKIDTDLFNNTLKYWSDKGKPVDEVRKDLDNSFKVAKNYIDNFTPEVAAKPTPTDEKKTEEPVDRRAKAVDEYEREMEKVNVAKAGNDAELDPIDQQAQDILKTRRSLNNENKKSWNGGLVY